MMNQKEWDLLSLCVALRMTDHGLIVLTPEEAQAIESSDGDDGEEVRNLSFFEEHVAKCLNGTICAVNGTKHLILNKTYFVYGYHIDVTSCNRILLDGNTLVSEIS